jgi:hypothetical protein
LKTKLVVNKLDEVNDEVLYEILSNKHKHVCFYIENVSTGEISLHFRGDILKKDLMIGVCKIVEDKLHWKKNLN